MSGFSKDESIFFENNNLITMLYFECSTTAEFNGSTQINEPKSQHYLMLPEKKQ